MSGRSAWPASARAGQLVYRRRQIHLEELRQGTCIRCGRGARSAPHRADRHRRFLCGDRARHPGRMVIFDVHTDPASRRSYAHHRDDFVRARGGVVGRHTSYALTRPDVVTVCRTKDHGGRPAMVQYTKRWRICLADAGADRQRAARRGENGKFPKVTVTKARALTRLSNEIVTSSFTAGTTYM